MLSITGREGHDELRPVFVHFRWELTAVIHCDDDPLQASRAADCTIPQWAPSE
jgi:hypothetical protein